MMGHDICERTITMSPFAPKEEVIIDSGFDLTFLLCNFANFEHHSPSMFMKSFDMLFVYLLDVNCVKLFGISYSH